MPFAAYTCLRWGALMDSTPADPDTFVPPPPREWYRFVLSHPDVSVALMAPENRSELEHDLALLEDWRSLEPPALAELRAHGDRVRDHAGTFW